MAITTSTLTFLIDALTDVKAGNELAQAIHNGSKLSSDTMKRLVIAMTDTTVANDIQSAILGTKSLSARDLLFMVDGFASADAAANVASNVAGGVAFGAAKTIIAPIVPVPVQVVTPTFSPAAGAYATTTLVTVSSLTDGVTFYYTTNGSTPTTGSTLYTGPISVASTETLKVLGVKTNFVNSAIASAAYTINGPVATPTFAPVAGSYVGPQSVTISSTTAGATFYYTTDGSTPTRSSTLYTGPITVSVSETVKVLGVKANFLDSAIASAAYTIS